MRLASAGLVLLCADVVVVCAPTVTCAHTHKSHCCMLRALAGCICYQRHTLAFHWHFHLCSGASSKRCASSKRRASHARAASHARGLSDARAASHARATSINSLLNQCTGTVGGCSVARSHTRPCVLRGARSVVGADRRAVLARAVAPVASVHVDRRIESTSVGYSCLYILHVETVTFRNGSIPGAIFHCLGMNIWRRASHVLGHTSQDNAPMS